MELGKTSFIVKCKTTFLKKKIVFFLAPTAFHTCCSDYQENQRLHGV